MRASVRQRLSAEVRLLAASGPLTAAVMAERLMQPARTVRRDFQLLGEVGLLEPDQEYGSYRLRPATPDKLAR